MRILIFIFLLSFLPSQIKGQDSPLFVIVSCSEGVMLDGKAVSPGQIVDANSNQLTIPKKGYTGVITNEGDALELNESISVSRIIERANLENHPKPIHDGGGTWQAIEIIRDPKTLYSEIAGDSVLLVLKDNIKKGPPYIIDWRNEFDEKLLLDTISNNWKTYSAKKIIGKEELVLMQVKVKEGYTQLYSMKSPAQKSKSKLKFDLSRIPQDSSNEKEFQLAIYHLNHFYYDQLFLLYQLERYNYQPQNKIFANYITQQKKKYQFHLFDFHK
jgi:hypothetical protein